MPLDWNKIDYSEKVDAVLSDDLPISEIIDDRHEGTILALAVLDQAGYPSSVQKQIKKILEAHQ